MRRKVLCMVLVLAMIVSVMGISLTSVAADWDWFNDNVKPATVTMNDLWPDWEDLVDSTAGDWVYPSSVHRRINGPANGLHYATWDLADGSLVINPTFSTEGAASTTRIIAGPPLRRNHTYGIDTQGYTQFLKIKVDNWGDMADTEVMVNITAGFADIAGANSLPGAFAGLAKTSWTAVNLTNAGNTGDKGVWNAPTSIYATKFCTWYTKGDLKAMQPDKDGYLYLTNVITKESLNTYCSDEAKDGLSLNLGRGPMGALQGPDNDSTFRIYGAAIYKGDKATLKSPAIDPGAGNDYVSEKVGVPVASEDIWTKVSGTGNPTMASHTYTNPVLFSEPQVYGRIYGIENGDVIKLNDKFDFQYGLLDGHFKTWGNKNSGWTLGNATRALGNYVEVYAGNPSSGGKVVAVVYPDGSRGGDPDRIGSGTLNASAGISGVSTQDDLQKVPINAIKTFVTEDGMETTGEKDLYLKFYMDGVDGFDWGIGDFSLTVKMGEPVIGELAAPAKVAPGEVLDLVAPKVSGSEEGYWLISEDGEEWEEFDPDTEMTLEYDGMYLCYYAENQLGETFSNIVRISVGIVVSIADITAPEAVLVGDKLDLTNPEVTMSDGGEIEAEGWQISATNSARDWEEFDPDTEMTLDFDGMYLRYYAEGNFETAYSNVVQITVSEAGVPTVPPTDEPENNGKTGDIAMMLGLATAGVSVFGGYKLRKKNKK